MGTGTAGGWIRVTLITLLAVLAALVLGIGYCLWNPNAVKPLAGHLTEAFTGRTLSIGGDVALDLSWSPRVVARDVRFGNADWSAATDMAAADEVVVQIDLRQLLNDVVHLEHLEVHGGTLNLEDRVGGQPNWALFPEDDEPSEWTFLIRAMRLTDVDVFANIGDLQPMTVEIPELTETSDDAGHLQLDGHGTLNGDPWRLDGRIGTLDEILIGGRIDMDLDLIVDDVELTVSGSIEQLATLSDLDLTISAYGPDAELFGEIFGMAEAFAGDVALTARISPLESGDPQPASAGSGHRLDVDGHIAAFQVAAGGTVLDLNALDGWDVDVEVQGPDAGVFGKALQIRGLPEGPFDVSGRVHAHGGDLDLTGVRVSTRTMEVALDADFVAFPKRDGAVANAHLRGEDLSQLRELARIPGLPESPFDLTLSLNGTEGEVASRLTVGTHVLEIDGYVGEYPTFHDTRLSTRLAGEDIAKLLLVAGIEDALAGSYEATAMATVDATGVRFDEVSFSNGPIGFAGRVHLPDVRQLEGASLSGRLDVASLAKLQHLAGVEGLPDLPISAELALKAGPDDFRLLASRVRYQSMEARVEADLADLGDLESIEARLTLSGPSIDELFARAPAEGRAALPFTLTAALRGRPDAIEVLGFELTGEGGSLSAEGVIMLSQANVGSRLSVRGRGPNLAATIPRFRGYTPPNAAWELDADISLPDEENVHLDRSFLEVGSASVSLAGRLDLVDQISTDILIEIHSSSFRDLGQIGDVQLPDLPFTLTTKLDGAATGINVTRFESTWGDSDVTATGSIALGETPKVVLRGTSKRMDLEDLQKAIFGELEDLDPEDDATRLFPDTPIPIEDLQAFSADVDVDIGAFVGRRARVEDVKLALTVRDGTLVLDRLAYRDDLGSFDAKATLSPLDDAGTVSVNLALQGNDANLGLFVSRNQAPESVPRYTLDVDIHGTGKTIAEVAGSLNGRMLISSDGGQIDNALVDAFAGDFISNVLDILNPFSNTTDFTPMECMVINATVSDGKLSLEPGFVMRTDQVNMFVYGKADLKTERLDLSLATQARRGIGLSAATITNPYFKVGGTLANPSLQLDAASAAVAASVASATAGLSIVIRGLWDRLMGGRNPCPEFRSYKQKSTGSE